MQIDLKIWKLGTRIFGEGLARCGFSRISILLIFVSTKEGNIVVEYKSASVDISLAKNSGGGETRFYR